VEIEGMSANAIEGALRKATPPIVGYIENDLFLMDVRTVLDEEIPWIASTFETILMEE
jgi:L-seryl-tRNA(Ser) seleniumtransferase